MKFMILVKASKDSEAGVMPSEALLAAMGKFNEELSECGGTASRRGPAPDVQRCACKIFRREARGD
jgi:hypothetical protein